MVYQLLGIRYHLLIERNHLLNKCIFIADLSDFCQEIYGRS